MRVYAAYPVYHDHNTNFYARGDILRELNEACIEPALFVKYFLFYGMFPVVFSPERGHRRDVYRGILAEAERAGQPKLVAWLRAELRDRALSYSVASTARTAARTAG